MRLRSGAAHESHVGRDAGVGRLAVDLSVELMRVGLHFLPFFFFFLPPPPLVACGCFPSVAEGVAFDATASCSVSPCPTGAPSSITISGRAEVSAAILVERNDNYTFSLLRKCCHVSSQSSEPIHQSSDLCRSVCLELEAYSRIWVVRLQDKYSPRCFWCRRGVIFHF